MDTRIAVARVVCCLPHPSASPTPRSVSLCVYLSLERAHDIVLHSIDEGVDFWQKCMQAHMSTRESSSFLLLLRVNLFSKSLVLGVYMMIESLSGSIKLDITDPYFDQDKRTNTSRTSNIPKPTTHRWTCKLCGVPAESLGINSMN